MNRNFEIYPQMETERLVLNEIKSEHAEDLSVLLSDEAVAKYEYFYPTQTLDQVHKFINHYAQERSEAEEITWGIFEKASNRLIGTCCLGDFCDDARRAEIGYAVVQSKWGKGYAIEALQAVLAYGFNVLDLNRIEGTITPGNDASIRVLEKLGFVREGHVRERDLIKGELVDGIIMGLLKKEFE